jgi:peptide-methionine (R)-S-oxide reductase
VAVVLLQCSTDPITQIDQATGKDRGISTPQNQMSMDTTKKDNPVYSRTDTTKVNLAESEWKKILTPDVYYIARQKGTERPWTSPIEHSQKVRPNLKAAADGPAFLSPFRKEASSTLPTTATACNVPKCNADVAKPTWVMFLMTDRLPPDFATVSTALFLILRNRPGQRNKVHLPKQMVLL